MSPANRIGTEPVAPGVTVRGIRHLSECVVAMFPSQPDDRCTCRDDSPDWTLS